MDLKLPKELMIPIVLLVGAGIIAFILEVAGTVHLLGEVANLAFVLTLAAVLAYVYYTYLLAKDAWIPCASFALKAYPKDPYHFAFLVQNHSKASLNCWCNLNATVYGQPVSLGRFYGGESSFDLQPFGGGNGHFDIRDLLAKAGRTLQEMKQKAGAKNVKDQLYLDIEFWYSPVGADIIVRNARQPHFFDFRRDVLVADF